MKTSTRNKGRNTPPTKAQWLTRRFAEIAHQARLLATDDAALTVWERRDKANLLAASNFRLWTVADVLAMVK